MAQALGKIVADFSTTLAPRFPLQQPITTMASDEKVFVEKIQVEPTKKKNLTQLWLQIRHIPSHLTSKMPKGTSISPDTETPAGASTSDVSASRGIWVEHPIAEATGGYDIKKKRTLINSFKRRQLQAKRQATSLMRWFHKTYSARSTGDRLRKCPSREEAVVAHRDFASTQFFQRWSFPASDGHLKSSLFVL
jgi:hypothetical protein